MSLSLEYQLERMLLRGNLNALDPVQHLFWHRLLLVIVPATRFLALHSPLDHAYVFTVLMPLKCVRVKADHNLYF
jgi:hypothetical protein